MVGGDSHGLCKLSSVHFYKRLEVEKEDSSTTLFGSLITTIIDNKQSLVYDLSLFEEMVRGEGLSDVQPSAQEKSFLVQIIGGRKVVQ